MPGVNAVYTVPEAAKRLGITGAMVRSYLRSRRLRGTKLGRDWVVPVDALEQFASVPRRRGNPKFGQR